MGLDSIGNLEKDLFEAGNKLGLLGLVGQLLVEVEEVELIDGVGELLEEWGVGVHWSI
jgi:hypothetical protein